MTCHILQRILSLLDLTRSFDFTFWAVCLVGFFSFFRKSNLLVPSLAAFDPQKHVCQSDVTLEASGAVISVRWSKTIQFRQRIIHIPLPHIPGSPFCPSSALYLCLHMVHRPTTPYPLFCYRTPAGVKPLTHSEFVTHLRSCLHQLGFNSALYSGHSRRKGRASFALQCGIPVELIKLQGDWVSNAYERYLYPALPLRKRLAVTLGNSFLHMTGN